MKAPILGLAAAVLGHASVAASADTATLSSSSPGPSLALERRVEALEQRLRASEDAFLHALDDSKQERRFNIYGFFDVNFGKWWMPRDSSFSGLVDQDPMFIFGNLNTYFDFKPHSDWRFLFETRFLFNPVADTRTFAIPVLNQSYSRVNVNTVDEFNMWDSFQFGSIRIERAHVDWTRYDVLSVSAGVFLTPFGIWNIDHGSPTRILATPPFMYLSWFPGFPDRQLGLKFYGSVPVGPLQFSYALTLANGRGPINLQKDSAADKAVGGRVELSQSGRVRWKGGVSAYTGTYTDFQRSLAVEQAGFRVDKELTVVRRDYVIGADFQLEVAPWRFQWEFIGSWWDYKDPYRPPRGMLSSLPVAWVPSSQGGPSGALYEPDRFAWATYGLVAYKLPFQNLDLRPFAMVSYVDTLDLAPAAKFVTGSLGATWRIAEPVVLKVEFDAARWLYPGSSQDTVSLASSPGVPVRFVTQLAVAF